MKREDIGNVPTPRKFRVVGFGKDVDDLRNLQIVEYLSDQNNANNLIESYLAHNDGSTQNL